MHMRPEYAEDGRLEYAKVTLEVKRLDAKGKPTYLTGIKAWMDCRQYVSMSVPAEEAWSDEMGKLTQQQRERIATPQFFQMLQQELRHPVRHNTVM